MLAAGKDVKTAFKGQPVTITLDKEVDVSRGCVIAKDTKLASYQKLNVSILWMDDEPLAVGTDYLVKLGTKTISGIITGIEYAVDVNTGEHIKADALNKTVLRYVIFYLPSRLLPTCSLLTKLWVNLYL